MFYLKKVTVYNPRVVFDGVMIFYNCHEDLTFYCYYNSTAYEYANNNYKLKLLFSKNVKGLKLKASGSSAVKLSWNYTGGATGYVVYRYDTNRATWIKVGKTGKTSYRVAGLKSGKNYLFAVKAYKKSGSSYTFGPKATIKTTTTPTKPRVSAYSNWRDANLYWNDVNNASGYIVYYKTSKSGRYKLLKVTSSTSFEKYGLKRGKTYYFAVKAYKNFRGKKYTSKTAYKAVKVK